MLIVDRKEGDFIVAIDENNEAITFHKNLATTIVKEGDCIFFNMNVGKYEIDKEETAKRKETIKNKFYKLIKNKQGENKAK